jgi:hypothetical protein
VHCPVIPPGRVLRTAPVRLAPFTEAILDAGRIIGDFSIANSGKQDAGIAHAILGITDEPPTDISRPVGRRFQGGARFLSAHLTLAWAASTGTAAAVLPEWDHVEGVEVVGHERHENLDGAGLRRLPESRNRWHRGNNFPSELRIIFLQKQNRGSKKVLIQRAPRPKLSEDFATRPPAF